jgi:uncharacterized protein (DUF885 family)
MKRRIAVLSIIVLVSVFPSVAGSKADAAFEKLAASFVDEYPALSPVGATGLGDHRFDGELDEVGSEARERRASFIRGYQKKLGKIDREKLSKANQVDYALLDQALASNLWQLEELQTWAWDPRIYTGLTGGAIYSLLARDFAPLPDRLARAADRLEQYPRLLEQVRATLVPERVPKIHAETAVRQNRGAISIIENMLKPELEALEDDERARVEAAVATATAAIEGHQKWLEEVLLPAAKGDFRIGCDAYERKLAFALNTPLTREDVRERAWSEYERIRREMYEVSKTIYTGEYPYAEFPDEPDEAYRQAITRAALEVAYRDLPGRDEIVDVATAQLEQATNFVRDNDLVSLPGDPVEVIIMPEFARGVSIAYCDSPGALDTGQKTFYAISPIPEDWTEKQVQSFLREYNVYSMQDLTVHEAMPGHYLQLAHSGRYPSTLRAVLQSGTFIEGWAVYAEQFMVDAGYNDDDPRQKLIALKWLIRSVTNALMDQAIHCDGMTRDEAMELMVEGGFQEEREAALKWVRAQLTSAQLSTYFVGYLEHIDLRREVEEAWGDAFVVRKYHDELLSFGSPPVRYVRSLMLDLAVPE